MHRGNALVAAALKFVVMVQGVNAIWRGEAGAHNAAARLGVLALLWRQMYSALNGFPSSDRRGCP